MKAIAIVGASVLGKGVLARGLIEAYRIDGFSVSCIKHAPDGFDMDQPGKASHVRREAGAKEVMLVGDRRLVLMREFGGEPEPAIEELLERLADVDVVIVEGFHDAPLPTIEVVSRARGRGPRYPRDPNVIALVCDEGLELPLRTFTSDDVGSLADFVAARVGLDWRHCRPERGSGVRPAPLGD